MRVVQILGGTVLTAIICLSVPKNVVAQTQAAGSNVGGWASEGGHFSGGLGSGYSGGGYSTGGYSGSGSTGWSGGALPGGGYSGWSTPSLGTHFNRLPSEWSAPSAGGYNVGGWATEMNPGGYSHYRGAASPPSVSGKGGTFRGDPSQSFQYGYWDSLGGAIGGPTRNRGTAITGGLRDHSSGFYDNSTRGLLGHRPDSLSAFGNRFLNRYNVLHAPTELGSASPVLENNLRGWSWSTLYQARSRQQRAAGGSAAPGFWYAYGTMYASAASTPVLAPNLPALALQQADRPTPASPEATGSKVFADKGETDFKSGNYKGAVWAWRHAVLDDPKNGVLLLMLAQSFFATGRYDEAAGATQQAMPLLPKDKWSVVIANRAELYGKAKDYTTQLRALENAVKTKPQDPALRFLAGFHYAALGFPQEAIDQLDKGLKEAPQDEMAQALREEMTARLTKRPVEPPPGTKSK